MHLQSPPATDVVLHAAVGESENTVSEGRVTGVQGWVWEVELCAGEGEVGVGGAGVGVAWEGGATGSERISSLVRKGGQE